MITKPNKVLIVAPHADDEVLGVGGTITKHIERGDIVDVVVVCDREGMNHQINQCMSARDILGYRDIHWLHLQDEHLDISIRSIIKPLEEVYKKLKPDIFYTCHGGDVNIDHQAVFKASVVVCRPLQDNPPARFISYEVMSSTEQGRIEPFVPNYYNTLTLKQVERKMQALEAYTDELRPLPNPRNKDGIYRCATKRGMECNSDYAEAFKLIYIRD